MCENIFSKGLYSANRLIFNVTFDNDETTVHLQAKTVLLNLHLRNFLLLSLVFCPVIVENSLFTVRVVAVPLFSRLSPFTHLNLT